jgi:uncharacterized protein
MKTLAVVLLLCCSLPAYAITIATGAPDGTYYQIAQDIKRVGEAEGIPVEIIQTNGSFDNLNFLGAGKADLAIIQLDVLKFATEVMKWESGFDLVDQAKVLLNLYPEEIHVLTKNENIRSLDQLSRRRVAVGPEGSGSALTAEVLLAAHKITVAKVFDGPNDALKKLDRGELDAMIFVGGSPVPALQNLDQSYRFVTVPKNSLLEEIYSKKVLDRTVYSWAGDVETLAVPSVILTRNRSDRDYVVTMQKLLLAILRNKSRLDSTGHPKWKDSQVGYIAGRLAYKPAVEVILVYTILDTLGYQAIKK